MAEEPTEKFISKDNSGFPEYLDFEKLRRAAIEYIGKLSGKLWTDHNIHDPGITILEVLIYALLDLGYRTNLPDIDLFTRNPEDKSKDNNFFTPAQILANNPLTITDFRKLLCDIEGVKNAWLEIEDNINADFCKTNNKNENADGTISRTEVNEITHENAVPDLPVKSDPCECEFINGLYHVYIQLEDEYEKDQNRQKYEEVISKIRHALMSHRNLCEDFIDIKVLCKLEIGLCADIELDIDADAEEVFLKIAETLKEFFSPSPKYYTLQELLDKQKPIEEIFAGRPFDLKESHGFIDTEEFEQIKLRRELHLSDVYHTLFDITGLKNVRNLGWIKCCGEKAEINGWKLKLPENYIPVFSMECSGFTFSKNGLPVKTDLKKLKSLFGLNFSGHSKVLFEQPSLYLDSEIPKGNYRNDLADYYSIQNEFPRVYGISEGGLANNVSDKRKAQALQLQGFLLFFDQLLANYLSQLKNIRSLFALSPSENNESNHSYFINRLTDAPQLQKLLRFSIDENDENSTGSKGSILAYPIDRKKLEAAIANGRIKSTDLEGLCDVDEHFPEHTFCYSAERDQAVNQLQQDLIYEAYEPVIESNYNGCYFFYIFTSSSEFALIGKRYFEDEKRARNAANSVKYIGTFNENYRSNIIEVSEDEPECFSFNIELNLDSYAKYLQVIVEDDNLYLTRRQDFLEHLLARFAERFSDYAMITSGFLSPDNLQKSQIKAGEKFLTHYDDISSNRGKAYDYLYNRWDNENISGFEKRFKALSGIENWKRHYLCNFTVEKADGVYRLTIKLFDRAFTVTGKTFNYESGLASLTSIYKKLSNDPLFETGFVKQEQQWEVFIKDELGHKYVDSELIPEESDSVLYRDKLNYLCSLQNEGDKNIIEYRYIHQIFFTGNNGVTIAESSEKFSNENDAKKFFSKAVNKLPTKLNDQEKFIKINKAINLKKLIPVKVEKTSATFIDEEAFDFKPFDDIHLDLVKKKYIMLSYNKTIQFNSVINYDTPALAKQGFKKLLVQLALGNFLVKQDERDDRFYIYITTDSKNNENTDVYIDSFTSEEEAKNKIKDIIAEINSHSYKLQVSGPIPNEWKFNYDLADISVEGIKFESKLSFRSRQEAIEASIQFFANFPKLKAVQIKNELALSLEEKNKTVTIATASVKTDKDILKRAKTLLQFHKDLYGIKNNSSEEMFKSLLDKGKVNAGEEFIYKLVDKDSPLAWFPLRENNLNDAIESKNKLIKASAKGYKYIEITFGEDALRERTDEKTKIKWFHYLIKCNNVFYKKGKSPGDRLVLYESTKGYSSKEDALKAFNDNYLLILKYGRLEINYVENKLIGLKETFIHSNDTCFESGSIVFIPEETSNEFKEAAIREIILLVKSYPVRYINKDVYKFALFNSDCEGKGKYDWCSSLYYKTAKETMEQFQYFLLLLKYQGNYYVDKNEKDCRYYIYIREVLALSAHGFPSQEAAWGKDGIEKFICVSQSKEGFHNYFNRNNCSYSFYIACGNTGLIHPCIYETTKRRDDVLNKLYQASKFDFFNLIEYQERYYVLSDIDKKPIAKIIINRNSDTESNCERLIEFFESVYFDDRFIIDSENEKHFYLINADKKTKIAEPFSEEIDLKEWKKQLLKTACYFPVIKDIDPCNPSEDKKYFVEIKLPGFDCCDDDLTGEEKYGGSSDDTKCKISCYVAWKSECCFDSCCEALKFYAGAFALLRKHENYKPVFDCECGSYRIELHPQLTIQEKKEFSGEIQKLYNKVESICAKKEGREPDEQLQCLSEIVAINPQEFTNEKMSCEAADRARKLINSEGLHLVEHILLRPRCKDTEDRYVECECEALPRPCIDENNTCHFEWKPGGDQEPCELDKTICFTPGCDPYSFISTVALPAWPERFRTVNNRMNIEKILQRELPAHILLRILWLNPRDLCCFEYHFKRWSHWMGHKLCDDKYDNCNFLEILFQKHFKPLSDCTECMPCPCDTISSDSCFDKKKEPCDDFNLLNTLNSLFCWDKYKDTYDFKNCEPYTIDEKTVINGGSKEPAFENIIKEGKSKDKDLSAKDNVRPVNDLAVTRDTTYEKSKRIQARSYSYRENVKKVIESNPGNIIADYALRFLSDTKPDPKRYDDLVNKILKNKSDKDKKIKGLTLKQKQTLIENVSWQYFDRICFTGNEIEKITMHQNLFDQLRKYKINMKSLYDGWKSGDIKKFEPGLDIKKIKNNLI